MYTALLVVFLLVAIALVGMILMQQGKGADMGASFGAGASATLFGSSGSGNFMTRTTGILATLFFVLSLVLGNMTSNKTVQAASLIISLSRCRQNRKQMFPQHQQLLTAIFRADCCKSEVKVLNGIDTHHQSVP